MYSVITTVRGSVSTRAKVTSDHLPRRFKNARKFDSCHGKFKELTKAYVVVFVIRENSLLLRGGCDLGCIIPGNVVSLNVFLLKVE